jgi:GntR family transcriptional regulator
MAAAFPVDELTPGHRGRGEGHIYEQIRDQLAAAIATHELPAGTQLPIAAELQERFKASRMTIRVALQELEAAGLVEPRHGVGVFVRDRPATPQIQDAAVVQAWVRAVDEIIVTAPTETQAQYLAVRADLPDWARPAP